MEMMHDKKEPYRGLRMKVRRCANAGVPSHSWAGTASRETCQASKQLVLDCKPRDTSTKYFYNITQRRLKVHPRK